jgi:hypothetical protein
MASRQYLVTIHDVGNITDKAENIRTILTSRDHILPAERVEVVEYVGHSGQYVVCKNTLPRWMKQ